jgi:hypothetical protein
MHLGLKTGPLCPILSYRSPVPLAKFQMAPIPSSLMSSGSKKKELRYVYLSEAKPHTDTEHGLRFPPQCRISYKWGYYLTPLYIDVFSGCNVQ